MSSVGRVGCLMVLAQLVLFGQTEAALLQTSQITDDHNVANRARIPPSSLSEAFAPWRFDAPTARGMHQGELWDAQSDSPPVILPHHADSPYDSHALGKRAKVGLIGAALLGTGVALVVTAERTEHVPRMCTRGFFPVVPGGCRPATTKTEIKQLQLGIGAGLLIGGMIVAFDALWPR